MPMPVLTVEIAFGDAWNDATPTWVDVTSYVRDSPPLRISRGISRVSRNRPGSLTLTLGNNDRRFDPDYVSGPYANDLVPLVPIRVLATHNAVSYPLFRGFVVSWNVGTRDFKDSTTTVEALDGLSVLELMKVQSPFAQLVASLSPKAWYRFSEPAGATTLVDSSGNGHHGTLSGVTLGSVGDISLERDRAGDFDGTATDYVELPLEVGIASGDITVLALFNDGNISPASNYSNFFAQGRPSPTGEQDTVSGQLDLRLFSGTDRVQFRTIPIGGSSVSSVSGDVVDANWHQAVGVISGTTMYLYMDGAQVDTDAWAGGSFVAQQIRIGYAGVTGTTGAYDGLLSELIVWHSAISAANISALYTTATAPWASQLTSARITAVLDAVGWPSADRDLDTGLSTMNELTTTSPTALAAIYEAVDTENGQVFITTAGKVWFGNRRWRDISAFSATFSNDGSDTGYQALTWHRDDTELRTVAQVTDYNDATTEYEGANSVTYGPRTISRTTQTTSVTEPYDMATWLYGEFGATNTNATLRLEAGKSSATATWAELLSRELGDLVNVEVKPVGGTTQNDWDMFVENITLVADVELWSTTLELVNAGGATTAGQRGFVLDDAVLGVLDGVGRLGF